MFGRASTGRSRASVGRSSSSAGSTRSSASSNAVPLGGTTSGNSNAAFSATAGRIHEMRTRPSSSAAASHVTTRPPRSAAPLSGNNGTSKMLKTKMALSLTERRSSGAGQGIVRTRELASAGSPTLKLNLALARRPSSRAQLPIKGKENKCSSVEGRVVAVVEKEVIAGTVQSARSPASKEKATASNTSSPSAASSYGRKSARAMSGRRPTSASIVVPTASRPSSRVSGSNLPQRPGTASKKLSSAQLQDHAKTLCSGASLRTLEQDGSSGPLYSMGKVLGEGAYGKVKIGTHLPTGAKVAIKTFEKGRMADAIARKRVGREIRILKSLDHPNIVQLFEVVDQPYRKFLVMEFAAQGDLCKHVRSRKRLQESEAKSIFVQVLRGLLYCHRRGVVHRDVKLDNILLGDNGVVKLVDFGFSVPFKSGQTLKKACGSPSYAAPEIVSRKAYDPPQVDVWSLGVVLFAMLAGFFPFQGANSQDLCRKISRGKFDLPSWIQGSSAALIKAMLCVEPDRRLTLEQVAEHPWASGQVSLPIELETESAIPRLKEEGAIELQEDDDVTQGTKGLTGVEPINSVLDECENHGFDKKFVGACVTNAAFNAASTMYWLTLRNRGKDLS